MNIKKRLLEKLESLQSELHKDIPNRQVVMGKVVEVVAFIRMLNKDNPDIRAVVGKVFKILLKQVGIELELPLPDFGMLTRGDKEGDNE